MSSLLLLAREGTVGGGGGGGGMTLPLLLGIAIGGGVLLFICLAFLLIALASRRHRAVASAHTTTPGVRLDLESDGGSVRTPNPRPRRLTKQKPGQVYTHMEEIQGKPSHSLSSLVLPWNGVFSVCGRSAKDGGGQQRGGNIRRNNSWIDEDAIHGPRVQNDGRRLSVRDSFILRTPTLPDMFGHDNKDDFKFPDDHNNYSLPQPPPVSLPTQRGGHPLQMPLRRTPSYELAEKLAAAARGGVPPGTQSFQPTQTFQGQPGAQGPRLMPLPRLRHRTTESDLAEILRSTEERLQNGTPSHSRPVTRQRASSVSAGSSVKTQQVSPPKSNSPVKAHQSPARSQSPVKIQVPQHVAHALSMSASRQGARTPSPSKRRVAAMLGEGRPQHLRDVSQCSGSSDADSLFGETTPEVEHMSPTGLSTPSRRSGNTTPTKPAGGGEAEESPGSDVSSSLSTLYSINEPEDDSKTGGTGHPEGIVRGRKPKGLVIDTQICDPFVTSAPDVPLRSPRRQTPSLPPLLTPHEKDMVKETVVYAPSYPRSASTSPVRRSFDAAKRSGVADQSRTQGSIVMNQPNAASYPDTVRPKSVTTMKPAFLVSSTTAVSMKASPGTSPEDNSQPANPSNRLTFGQKGTVLPPPLDLIPGRGSPVPDDAMDGPESVPRAGASPTVRNGPGPYTSNSPTRKDKPSPAFSAGSPTPVRYRKRDGDSPVRDRGISRQPHARNRSADRVLPSSDRPSIVLKPTSSPRRGPQHRDFGAMGLQSMRVQSTVAELRRMNSQMSALSVGSSLSDPESPTLPALRGGGFSPDRSNSRVSKMGRQNYLSLGTSPKGRRHTLAAIKTHRNSIAVLKARPEANKPFDPLRATVEEEDEDAGGLPFVRGPRPMGPAPKRAGRGATGETEAAVESPARRRTAHIDGDDQEYMAKAAKRNSDYESASVLDMYIKAAQLLGSPDRPATGA
ncbi:hypothetical protein LX36DRAFT_575506 [Colletotrichum falcatum]|nr:hypothetical protein LX36DRAFT_575506 [Colletotrichum falcatum]